MLCYDLVEMKLSRNQEIHKIIFKLFIYLFIYLTKENIILYIEPLLTLEKTAKLNSGNFINCNEV